MANGRVVKVGAIAGLTAAFVSALLPSPTTIAKFKPWSDSDKTVRTVFWVSIGVGVALAVVLFAPLLKGRN